MKRTLNQIEAHILIPGHNLPPPETPSQERPCGRARFSSHPENEPFSEQDHGGPQLPAREIPKREGRSTPIFRPIMQCDTLDPFILPCPTGARTPRAQVVGSARRPVERGGPRELVIPHSRPQTERHIIPVPFQESAEECRKVQNANKPCHCCGPGNGKARCRMRTASATMAGGTAPRRGHASPERREREQASESATMSVARKGQQL